MSTRPSRDLRRAADLAALREHRSTSPAAAHAAIARELWTAFRTLGFTSGRVLAGGEDAATFLGLAPGRWPGGASGTAVVGPDHAPVRPLNVHPGWQGPDEIDLAITSMPVNDVTLRDPSNIVARRADQVALAILTVRGTRPGGLSALLASHDLMDDPVSIARREIASMADLVGAVRLPSGAHRHQPGTDLPTDLLLFRRRHPGEPQRGANFETAPGINLDGARVTINTYFDTRPDRMLGRATYDPTSPPPTNLALTGDRNRFAVELRAAFEQLTAEALHNGLTMTPAREPAPSHGIRPNAVNDVDRYLSRGQRLRSGPVTYPGIGLSGWHGPGHDVQGPASGL
ncbi:hypothetical protein [Georgenia thermotolerans]|uniref:Uncharacterized protein n=1 Tax=Georgenia thermotolerans TaxID=527326 RepID=A0A7J5UM26_9MICO|nr:hypothetical protein [Georgenia thermotolerans]KAE8763427.1 hypothetical protein GB883_14185 [Georgenia thermotolerans]